VAAAAALPRDAGSVVVQLQQPVEAALAAARLGRAGGARVVLDGVPPDGPRRAELLACADVLRADDREAEQLAGHPLDDVAVAVETGTALLDRGPSLVVLGVAGKGNVFVSRADGRVDAEFLPHAPTEVVDTTGSGDALIAGLTAALAEGQPPRAAARLAVAAAAATTEHAGGRPHLTPDVLGRMLDHYR
jgi:ribokinase